MPDKTPQGDYKKIAKQLGMKHLYGRWGIRFLPPYPSGGVRKLFTIQPLDGWILDPKEIEHHFRENGFEL